MNPKPVLLMCLLYAATTLSMPTNTPYAPIIQQLIQNECQEIEEIIKRESLPFSIKQELPRTIEIHYEILKAMSHVKSIQEAREVNRTIFPTGERLCLQEENNRRRAHICIEDFLDMVENKITGIKAGEQLTNDIEQEINDNDL